MSEQQKPESGPQQAKANADWFCRWMREGVERTSALFEPPASAGKHFREAKLEFLRGVRELIDHRIDRLSRKPSAKGTRVVVE